MAASRSTTEQLAVLSQACCDMVVILRDYQREAKLMADGRYHCARFELSGKVPLTDITIRYRDRVRRGHSFVVRFASDNDVGYLLI